jgi:ABC-type lipoprotein release transport system permease subunit
VSLLFFSIRNAFRKKAVAALAVSGVAFGCALMTFLFSVASGMENRVEQTFSNLSGRIMVTQKGSVFGGVSTCKDVRLMPLLQYSTGSRLSDAGCQMPVRIHPDMFAAGYPGVANRRISRRCRVGVTG